MVPSIDLSEKYIYHLPDIPIILHSFASGFRRLELFIGYYQVSLLGNPSVSPQEGMRCQKGDTDGLCNFR